MKLFSGVMRHTVGNPVQNETMRTAPVLVLFVLLAAGLLSACSSRPGDDEAPLSTVAGDLVSWCEAGSFDEATLNKAIAVLGASGVSAKGGVTCFALTYRTANHLAVLVNASGLICLPAAASGVSPVVSYQHGTIFQDSEAPSRFITSGEALLGAVLASLGFIAVLPDYIGYGASAGEPHPYLHAATLASAVVDMNRAARAFLAERGISAAGGSQFFLAGYSEGGYATLAAQRFMEQNLTAEFAITASEPGAGPYDLTGTARTILGYPNQPQPAFIGFFLNSYDFLYNSPSRLGSTVSAAYADVVATHFDGTYSGVQITSSLGGVGVPTRALFQPDFLAAFLDSGEVELKARIAENDIYDWAPAVPTRLFHGINDAIVPYANATTAKTTMEARGSTAVTVVDCDAGTLPATHDNCARPFAVDMISFFGTLAAGL